VGVEPGARPSRPHRQLSGGLLIRPGSPPFCVDRRAYWKLATQEIGGCGLLIGPRSPFDTAVTFQTDVPAGFTHVDVKYRPPLNVGAAMPLSRSIVPPALVYLEILPDRRATTAAGFLARSLERVPGAQAV
jgi:hypothetical protein